MSTACAVQGAPVRSRPPARPRSVGGPVVHGSLLERPSAFEVAAFGGGVGVVSGEVDAVAALSSASGSRGWRVTIDDRPVDSPWGVIVSAQPLVGEVAGRGLVVTLLEPSEGGALLGLLRGAAGLLDGATVIRATRVLVRGAGAVHLDGREPGEEGAPSSWLFER